MWSAISKQFARYAIMITVFSLKMAAASFKNCRSVSKSMLEVASSKIMMSGSFKNTLAKRILWRCPVDKLSSWLTEVSNWEGSFETNWSA